MGQLYLCHRHLLRKRRSKSYVPFCQQGFHSADFEPNERKPYRQGGIQVSNDVWIVCNVRLHDSLCFRGELFAPVYGQMHAGHWISLRRHGWIRQFDYLDSIPFVRYRLNDNFEAVCSQ